MFKYAFRVYALKNCAGLKMNAIDFFNVVFVNKNIAIYQRALLNEFLQEYVDMAVALLFFLVYS